MDLHAFLVNLPAFDSFGVGHLRELSDCLDVSDYPTNHVFIQRGKQGEGLYIILNGSVSLRRGGQEGGNTGALKELGPGEIFGTLSLMDDLPAYLECVSRGPVQAAKLDRNSFQKLLSAASPIGRHLQYMIAVQLARDLYDLNQRIVDDQNGPVTQRFYL